MSTARAFAASSPPPPTSARAQLKVEWSSPPARRGLPGVWDRFVGPGATRGENLLQSIVPIVAAIGAATHPVVAELSWPGWKVAVAALLAADIAGGVVTNSTNTAKRWYHRDGRTAWHHIAFVAAHILQIALVGLVFRSNDWAFVACCYGATIAGSAAIAFAPAYLQRPIASTLYLSALVGAQFVAPTTPGLEWFLPAFFLKLFVAHVPIEAPLSIERGARHDG